jgi:hypothetical protein
MLREMNLHVVENYLEELAILNLSSNLYGLHIELFSLASCLIRMLIEKVAVVVNGLCKFVLVLSVSFHHHLNLLEEPHVLLVERANLLNDLRLVEFC